MGGLRELQAVELMIVLGNVVDAVHHRLVDPEELLVPERHLLARLNIDAGALVITWLRRPARVDAHLSIFDEKVELLLAVADVVLIEAVVEVVASVLGADVVRSKDLWIRLA